MGNEASAEGEQSRALTRCGTGGGSVAGEAAARAQSGWVESQERTQRGKAQEQIKLLGADASLE